MYRHATPLQVIIHQSARGRSEKTQFLAQIATLNSIIYICTRARHYFLSFAHSREASTVIPLLSLDFPSLVEGESHGILLLHSMEPSLCVKLTQG